MGETWEDFALKGKKISRKLEWENCGKNIRKNHEMRFKNLGQLGKFIQ